MANRRRKSASPESSGTKASPDEERSEPFYKRPWILALGSIVAVSFTFVLNSSTFFQNLRSLPGEFGSTRSELTSWAKDDSSWTGHWSAFPEGYADMEDLELSDVDLQIVIWAKEGEIDGTIATKTICRVFPFWNYVLLKGSVDSNSAVVTAWDIIQGHKRDFATLRLERQGEILHVTPLTGAVHWFPANARIARHPSESGDEPDPDQEFCKEERAEFLKRIHKPPGTAAN